MVDIAALEIKLKPKMQNSRQRKVISLASRAACPPHPPPQLSLPPAWRVGPRGQGAGQHFTVAEAEEERSWHGSTWQEAPVGIG